MHLPPPIDHCYYYQNQLQGSNKELILRKAGLRKAGLSETHNGLAESATIPYSLTTIISTIIRGWSQPQGHFESPPMASMHYVVCTLTGAAQL